MTAKRVLIVGGGSAGWITAAYMDAVLNGSTVKAVQVSVIESPDVGRIGVGEATVPSIRDTMRTIGVAERDFLTAADATFKQAIKFVGWLEGKGEHYYHPFDRRQTGRLDRSGIRWMTSDRSRSFADTVSVQPALCELNLAPKPLGTRDYEAPLSYAYHMDAEKTADYLCSLATARGVVHHKDYVTRVELAESGDIAAVHTRTGLRLEADLFIDCTGFRALLIGDALGGRYIDYSQWLLCDRAVAMRVPFEAHFPGSRKPYTLSTALSAGWCWDIGLAARRGVGYVYSSRFLDDDAAEAELRAFEGPHCEGLPVRRLQFQTGRREHAWIRNCVSIGLSQGFIEPLESTGLFLVELSAALICEYFPFGTGSTVPLAARFNKMIQERYEETLDFVVLHYCLTRRNDTAFWREVQKTERLPERLQDNLIMWERKPPSLSDFHQTLQLFSHHTYEYVLYGMDFQRERIEARGQGMLPPTRIPRPIAENLSVATARLPRHDDWLRQAVGGAYLEF